MIPNLTDQERKITKIFKSGKTYENPSNYKKTALHLDLILHASRSDCKKAVKIAENSKESKQLAFIKALVIIQYHKYQEGLLWTSKAFKIGLGSTMDYAVPKVHKV